MSELDPLAEHFDDFESQLLHSTGKDAPAAGAAAKTLAALGLAPTVTAATAATAAASIVGRSLTVWSVVKGLGIGALAGGALMVAADLAQQPAKEPRALLRASAHASTALTSAATSAAQRAAEAPAAAVASADRPSNDVASQVRRVGPAAAASAADPSSSASAPLPSVAAFAAQPSSEPISPAPNAISIADQVRSIDRARGALKSGRASEALSEASAYMQRWPSGPLAIEALIVRVEAELALGDRASAERDAERVISGSPGSRYAARVRQLFSPPLPE